MKRNNVTLIIVFLLCVTPGFAGEVEVTYVLKPSEQFEVLAVNKLDDGLDCSPAFVDNEMYLKGKQNLYCIASSD